EGAGGLVAAVAERARRSVTTVAIGHGVRAVLGGVDEKAEAEIDDVFERVIEHANAMARGHRFDGLWQENARIMKRAMFLEHLVEPPQLANRPAPVGARADEAGELRRERRM